MELAKCRHVGYVLPVSGIWLVRIGIRSRRCDRMIDNLLPCWARANDQSSHKSRIIGTTVPGETFFGR